MKNILLKTITALAAFFPIFYSNAQITGQWAWMSGANIFGSGGSYGTLGTAAAANAPANRDGHSTWKDASGNFWLFGGEDETSKDYNDLWEYSPGTGWWTWVSGSSSTNATAVYGAKGVAAAANHPGARFGQAGWTDASGNIWIFGGDGFTAGSQGYLNELWESPSANIFSDPPSRHDAGTRLQRGSSTLHSGIRGRTGYPAKQTRQAVSAEN